MSNNQKGHYTASINGVTVKHISNAIRTTGINYDTVRMQVKRSPTLSKEYKVGNNIIIINYIPFNKI